MTERIRVDDNRENADRDDDDKEDDGVMKTHSFKSTCMVFGR